MKQPDLFTAAADEQRDRRRLSDEQARAAENRRDADILARMLLAHQRALDALCPRCVEAFETRLAEEDPL